MFTIISNLHMGKAVWIIEPNPVPAVLKHGDSPIAHFRANLRQREGEVSCELIGATQYGLYEGGTNHVTSIPIVKL